MLSTEERAIDILEQIHNCNDKNDRISIIEKALKEQDKITKEMIADDLNRKIEIGEMIPYGYAINIIHETKSI